MSRGIDFSDAQVFDLSCELVDSSGKFLGAFLGDSRAGDQEECGKEGGFDAGMRRCC